MTTAEGMVLQGTVAAPEAFLRDFDEVSRAAGELPEWAATLRRSALERFAANGFPTTKNEDWRFTSVSGIAETDFLAMTAPGGEVTREALAPFLFSADWHAIVFVNGRHAPELSTPGALPTGVRVLALADALREMPELLEKHLGRSASFDSPEQAFTALNTAYILDGAVVHLAREAVCEKPIHLVYVTDAMAARGAMHPRNLVVADRHAKGTVVESYVALGEANYLTNAVTEISVADGATLTHLKIQRESSRAFHVGTIEATQGRDSHFVSFSFSIGGRLTRTNVYAHLAGEGCGATLNGLYMLDGEQHTDHQTLIVHAQPNCYSRELYKGVLDGTSHGVFNGKVYVDPIAQKTDGKQTNNTLLLSPRATIDTKPQLEIFADDVKCTHGATVGRIDETALFYMKSRGVSSYLARRLLTYAFAADVLETIEDGQVRMQLEALTLERFTQTAGMGNG